MEVCLLLIFPQHDTSHSLGSPHRHSASQRETFNYGRSLLGHGPDAVDESNWRKVFSRKEVTVHVKHSGPSFNDKVLRAVGVFHNVNMTQMQAVLQHPGTRKLCLTNSIA